MKLTETWNQNARCATTEDLNVWPSDAFLDREGESVSPLKNGDIELYYLPKESRALQMLTEQTRNSGCLKQPTRAFCVRGNEIIGVGANAGKKLNHCPRVKYKCKTGEGYEYCRDPHGCHQIEHAEVMSLLDALQKISPQKGAVLLEMIHQVNKAVAQKTVHKERVLAYARRNEYIRSCRSILDPEAEGLSLVLDGHWWVCQSCMAALLDAGVTKIYLSEGAQDAYDPQSPMHILPRFDAEGKVL